MGDQPPRATAAGDGSWHHADPGTTPSVANGIPPSVNPSPVLRVIVKATPIHGHIWLGELDMGVWCQLLSPAPVPDSRPWGWDRRRQRARR